MPLYGEDRRRYQRDWMRKQREEFLSDKSCVRCGQTDHLDIDHVDPSKKITHRFWSWSKERREAELAKCQVLCRACHKKKTRAEKATKAAHGTRARYKSQAGPCRCNLCRRANADYNRRWRASTESACPRRMDTLA